MKSMLFFLFITTFYNFALEIETGWGKSMVKPILETINANLFVFRSLVGFFSWRLDYTSQEKVN